MNKLYRYIGFGKGCETVGICWEKDLIDVAKNYDPIRFESLSMGEWPTWALEERQRNALA